MARSAKKRRKRKRRLEEEERRLEEEARRETRALSVIRDASRAEAIIRQFEQSSRAMDLEANVARLSLSWNISPSAARFLIKTLPFFAIDVLGLLRACRLPRVWDLMGHLFFTRTRERVWTPTIEEMKGDYARARRKYRTRIPRLWLRLCYILKTVVLLLQTWKVGLLGLLWMLLPEHVRGWLRHVLRLP